MKRRKSANLLLITFDQWRGDWGNPYNPVVDLKNLKSLADRGLTATRCYSNSPHCVPARFSWLTGLEPSQMGVTENQEVWMPQDAPSFVRELRDNGWYTSLVGKTHWTPHTKPYDLRENIELLRKLGFEDAVEIGGPRAMRRLECELTDEWQEAGILKKHREDLEKRYGQGFNEQAWSVRETVLPNHLYPDIWITHRAIKKIKEMPTDRPWFLWVSFCGPHEPFDTPKPWKGIHQDQELPEPIKTGEWIKEQPEQSILKQTVDKWSKYLNVQSIRECRKDYADHLVLLDDQIGKIITSLNQRKDSKYTAITITSDHGEHLGDANCLYKGTLLESAIRVPLIYCEPSHWLRSKKPQIISKPTSLSKTLGLICTSVADLKSNKQMKERLSNDNYVISEFKDEIAIIKGKLKVVAKRSGEIMWATKPESRKGERSNILENKKMLESNKKLKTLIDLLMVEIKRRKSAQWLWRDLKL